MRASAISMPLIEVAVLAPGLIELHQRLTSAADAGRRNARVARPVTIFRAQAVSSGGARRPADEDPAPARRVLRRDRIERSFDPHRADVREEGESRRRTGLERVAHEMPIEVEHRRRIGLQEGDADQVRPGRRRDTDAHLGNLVASGERARVLVPRRAPPGAAPRPRALAG